MKRVGAAAEDLKVKRVFVLYPRPDTFPLDEAGRFTAVAWRDLAGIRTKVI
ncbi:MAG: hypothetical protein ABSF95_22695 [Verrucomicrobiota bacterium]|jgi:hypothetical protein